MDGREKRIPVPPIEGRILHEHDLSRHSELGRGDLIKRKTS